MIDLEKKKFDKFWAKASQTLDTDSYDAFEIWLESTKQAQAEITDLKQQLSEAHKSRASWVEYSQKIESGEFVLMPKQLLGIKVSDDDTNLIDAEITQKSNELIADLLINNGEEELEMLVAKAMKLGELYERKRLQRSMVEAVEKEHE